MREENPLNSELQELESALSRSMKPTATSIDPVAAAFAAGTRQAKREVRAWQFAVAAIVLISIGIWPMRSYDGPAHAPIASVTIEQSPVPPASPTSVVMLQRAMLADGPDVLPQSQLPVSTAFRASDGL